MHRFWVQVATAEKLAQIKELKLKYREELLALRQLEEQAECALTKDADRQLPPLAEPMAVSVTLEAHLSALPAPSATAAAALGTAAHRNAAHLYASTYGGPADAVLSTSAVTCRSPEVAPTGLMTHAHHRPVPWELERSHNNNNNNNNTSSTTAAAAAAAAAIFQPAAAAAAAAGASAGASESRLGAYPHPHPHPHQPGLMHQRSFSSFHTSMPLSPAPTGVDLSQVRRSPNAPVIPFGQDHEMRRQLADLRIGVDAAVADASPGALQNTCARAKWCSTRRAGTRPITCLATCLLHAW